MTRPIVLALFLSLVSFLLCDRQVEAQLLRAFKPVPALEGHFQGQVLDFTANHGADRRIFSEALDQKRDLYVYLPPGYDQSKKYPYILWLHGIEQDEKGILEHGLAEIDQAMASGRLPPAILAVPDGSVKGRLGYFSANSSFLNTRAGAFEDFLFKDVDPFLRRSFSIRPERKAHVLAGVSLGGGSAFHHGIVRRDEFGIVIGIFPPLNVRWLDCRGRYHANFDLNNWGWREHYHLGLKPVAKFYGGLVQVPWRRLVHPLYGHGNQVVAQMSAHNPIEMIDTHNLKEGELDMLIAYGGKDEFNIDAQVESFLARAAERGLAIKVLHDPNGRHDVRTAMSFLPATIDWLAVRLEPYRVK